MIMTYRVLVHSPRAEWDQMPYAPVASADWRQFWKNLVVFRRRPTTATYEFLAFFIECSTVLNQAPDGEETARHHFRNDHKLLMG